ncbi:hypothetical protein D3C85_845790 [compost metagenome]
MRSTAPRTAASLTPDGRSRTRTVTGRLRTGISAASRNTAFSPSAMLCSMALATVLMSVLATVAGIRSMPTELSTRPYEVCVAA